MKAVKYGRCETVKSLISDYGCDISIKDSNGYSLLHIAIVEGHMEMFEMFVSEFGMSPIVIDGDGNTPLMLVMKKEKNELVLALLEKYSCGSNTKDNEGNSPLHVACMKGNLAIFQALVSHGVALESDMLILIVRMKLCSYCYLSMAVIPTLRTMKVTPHYM